ncbi:MAG: hypothetical protein RL660_93 [Bacteroidota bacterium]
MKKFVLSLVLACSMLVSKADEGMWLPYLISQNIDAMQKLGCKLTAADLYDVNKGSLKDAIVHFGGFCTGEIISKQGLILTNHHCGYDAIAGLSTVEKNYLRNGFAATTNDMELPCPGLFVRFLVRVEDVTAKITKATKKLKGEARDKKMAKLIEEWEKAEKANGYEIVVRPFYAGNMYLMMVYEKFTDIRLVAAPPENLGKFGGDTDNWMWPRHTCDFSMFRVYSDNNNKPAGFSKNNRPYQPKHSLPVSLRGVQENDYAMIFGYPGRTQRYLTSYGVDLAINESNPAIVKIRDKALGTMREFMDKDEALDLKYSSLYANIANYWKYFIGQTEQLKGLNVIDTKRKEEAAFTRWAEGNKDLNGLFDRYQSAYNDYKSYNKYSVYLREALNFAAITDVAAPFVALRDLYAAPKPDQEKIAQMISRIKNMRKGVLEEADINVDKKLFSALNLMTYQDNAREKLPSVFADQIFKRFGSNDWSKTFNDYADYVYSNTNLWDDAKFDAFMKDMSADKLMTDPAIAYYINIVDHYKANYEAGVTKFGETMAELNKAYQGALLQKNAGKLMYPDANSTMRMTYGQVKAIAPKDAVFFNYYTTAEGLLEKYKAGDKEFDLNNKTLELLRNKTYGDYADRRSGQLITCFITNNDITGGNSGSPVIDGNGRLIGLAFDGNWEAMSGDISFDQKYKRTICADIRYVMWVVDKVLDGGALMTEMNLVR